MAVFLKTKQMLHFDTIYWELGKEINNMQRLKE